MSYENTTAALTAENPAPVVDEQFQANLESRRGYAFGDAEIAMLSGLPPELIPATADEQSKLIDGITTSGIWESRNLLNGMAEFASEGLKTNQYDHIIGDDTSGHLPALFLHEMALRYASEHPGVEAPDITYIAGGRGIENRIGAIQRHLGDTIGQADPTSEQKTLFVTDNIETGNSIEPVVGAIKDLGHPVEVVTASLQSGKYSDQIRTELVDEEVARRGLVDADEETREGIDNSLGWETISARTREHQEEEKAAVAQRLGATVLHASIVGPEVVGVGGWAFEGLRRLDAKVTQKPGPEFTGATAEPIESRDEREQQRFEMNMLALKLLQDSAYQQYFADAA